MNQGKNTAIFYIDSENGFYYGGTQMLTLSFPKDIVSDQDILSKEKYYALIKAFIASNKILPSQVILVFAPVLCYVKSYEGTSEPTEKDNQEIRDFMELVPYEDVLSRTYKLNKKINVICVNRDFVTTTKQSFEKEQFAPIAAVPYPILQIAIPELSENIDFDLMLARFDGIKQYNMIEATQPSAGSKTMSEVKPKKNTRMYALLAAFGALALVLVFMVINTFVLPGNQKKEREVKVPGTTSPTTFPQGSTISSEESFGSSEQESSSPSGQNGP